MRKNALEEKQEEEEEEGKVEISPDRCRVESNSAVFLSDDICAAQQTSNQEQTRTYHIHALCF